MGWPESTYTQMRSGRRKPGRAEVSAVSLMLANLGVGKSTFQSQGTSSIGIKRQSKQRHWWLPDPSI